MRRISRCLVCAAVALLSLAAPGADAPNQQQPFTLTLAARKQPLKAGKPLVLRVTITNASDGPVHISTSNGGGNGGKVYQVHVLDEQGRPAPRRSPPPLPNGMPGIRFGSVHGMELKPGESKTDLVNVTDLYNLIRPGKYRIWIAEPFYRGPNLHSGLVRSNTITITVVE